jgi:hypothetical protein
VTRVVNVKSEPYDVYIGRNMRKYPGGKWGNPFKIGKVYRTRCGPHRLNRHDVIRLYRIYLSTRLIQEPDFLEPLRGKVLGCWCKPEACHGDVIAAALKRGLTGLSTPATVSDDAMRR